MEENSCTKDMERIELPKMKKAFVSLQKLDMLTKMPVSEGEDQNDKASPDTMEENEDPSIESVSTGSAESNVVCTDDDDLEKKIQAFSIPVKKDDGKKISKTENDSVKSSSDKNVIIVKGSEGIKTGKKLTSKSDKSKEKATLKTDVKTSSEPAATPNVGSVNKGTRKKKVNPIRNITNSLHGKMLSSRGNACTDKEQELNTSSAKHSDINTSGHKAPVEHNLRNGKGDKHEKKTRKDEPGGIPDSITGSEVRKRKIQKDENAQIKTKKLSIEKKKLELSSEPKTSAPSKERNRKSIDIKPKSGPIKRKKILPSKGSSKLSDRSLLHVKRSARISSASNKSKYDLKRSTEKKLLRNKTQRKSIDIDSRKEQISKVDVKKRPLSSKHGNETHSKLKRDEAGKFVGKKMKEKTSEKITNVGTGKKGSRNPSVSKEESTKSLEKVTGVLKDSKQTFASSENVTSNSKVEISAMKSDKLDKKLQKHCSDVFDDGEELFEKICDLLEEASGVPDSERGEKRNVSQKLYLSNQGTIFPPNEERLLITDPFFFKPRILHKNSKFPSCGKGTVSFKKLWKWSHYVKMPSDMWSIYKHPEGSFVVVFHFSAMSPFPKLIIDKCILFKETASPCVTIYGKEVLALSSEIELQTLGNVCSFLKHIDDISLCEGMLSSSRAESNNNCELYTVGKVSSPYKCKSCV